MFALKSDKDLEFLMAVGTSDHVLGPLYGGSPGIFGTSELANF